MKSIFSTFLFLALALLGLSCQNESSAVQDAVSFDQPFNIPFGQSVVLPDQSRLIFAQVLNNPIFRTVSNHSSEDTRVKMIWCKSDNEKVDFVLSSRNALNLRQLGLGNIKLQLVDLFSPSDLNPSNDPGNYIVRLALMNSARP